MYARASGKRRAAEAGLARADVDDEHERGRREHALVDDGFTTVSRRCANT